MTINRLEPQINEITEGESHEKLKVQLLETKKQKMDDLPGHVGVPSRSLREIEQNVETLLNESIKSKVRQFIIWFLG